MISMILLFCLVNADCHIIDYEKLATQTQYDYILGQCDQATHTCLPINQQTTTREAEKDERKNQTGAGGRNN